ncbi:hypothetical protein SDC9_209042 [bioreactor metagenome]|uniref:Uncharacterized protein n=1 Tax=bioreactor metagenome TaxID=1076179 RepID=A0A645JD95_9ZZZZ
MAEHLGVVGKLEPVLVVIGATDDFITQPDGKFCSIQMCSIAGKAIQIYEGHVVRGADGGLCRVSLLCFLEEVLETMRCLYSQIQKGAFSGGPCMDTSCRDEVAEVVSFEIEAVSQFLLFCPLLELDGVLGENIAIFTLHRGDELD